MTHARFLFAALLIVAGFSQGSMAAESRPNVVYILCDDLGYGDVSCLNSQGKIATPQIDRLAREGLVSEPRYLPAWAKDLSHLTAFMSYTAFLSRSDLVAEQRRLDDQIAQAEADFL